MAQPLADRSVWMPWMVARLTWSNDVQVELLRSLQPPLDDQVMPDDRKREVASAWLSLVTRTPIVGVPDVGLRTGSFSCAVACAPAVLTRSAVAAAATTVSART